MSNWIHVISQTPSFLTVALKDPEKMDLTIFEKMANDEACLRCVLEDPVKGRIQYSVENLVSLKDFLYQVTFEKKEGYLFLKRLFEFAISVNRNKPVLFDPSYVYVSPYGDAFYFLVVPLVLEEWMFQREQVLGWIQYLLENFQTNSAYEIPGYMMRFSKSAEFSLPNLILGLDNLQRFYYPVKKRWLLFREKDSFRLKEPVQTLFYGNRESDFVEAAKIQDENETQLIGSVNPICAWLQDQTTGQRYELALENNLIGRMVSCDIRLLDDSISLKHALILCENDRYYIKDLKSLNKTYLNDKPVIRKMRLKSGMQIRFGSVSCLFYQNETDS